MDPPPLALKEMLFFGKFLFFILSAPSSPLSLLFPLLILRLTFPPFFVIFSVVWRGVAVCCSECYSVCSGVLLVQQWVAVCCSVMPYVAVRCSVLQCIALCYSELQWVAGQCLVLQCVTVCCSVLQWFAVCCSATSCVACSVFKCVTFCAWQLHNLMCCSVLQCVTVRSYIKSLLHVAVCCSV